MNPLASIVLAFVFLLTTGATGAPEPSAITLTVSSIFTDHAVLQRNGNAPVWGMATPGESVVVSVAGHQGRGIADSMGHWRVGLRNLPAGGPYVMTIAGRTTLTLNDVLVGDVWLAAGQSNMAYAMSSDPENAAVAAQANDSALRFARAPVVGSLVMQADFPSPIVWAPSVQPNASWSGMASAVAYYFGREIRKHEHVPVGIVETVYGATSAEAWAAASVTERDPTLQSVAQARLQAAQSKSFPLLNYTPGAMFNSMVAPLTGYGISGVIWYQGESNDWPDSSAPHYRELLTALIGDWRSRWRWDVPFYIVQLHGFDSPSQPGDPNTPTQLAILREAQLDTVRSVPNTFLAVSDDLGTPDGDIHPPDKVDVGLRLALIARARRYGEKNITYQGPAFAGMVPAGNHITIRFTNATGGLVAKNGPLRLFAVAGKDGKYAWADARINGTTVVVTSPAVPKPVSVRYAWVDNPLLANLYNGAGLPAAPFRSDRP